MSVTIFKKIMAANRGEIAIRIFRACTELGISTVAIYSEEDRLSLHRYKADEAYQIGKGKGPIDAYLAIDEIIDLARKKDVDAIHPGYGFLSENADFAEVCESCDITFIGPTPTQIRQLGDKVNAKELMEKAGVPCTPGSDGVVATYEDAIEIAEKIGYPIILKAVSGGGGKGMRVARNDITLKSGLKSTALEAEKSFSNAGVYIEKYVENPRHVEVQLLADNYGKVLHLWERDCSLQRRHQKLVEESPAPNLPKSIRDDMCKAAVRLAKTAGYTNAGTVEFIVDAKRNFYFLEMNTRLQVEHPVTELIPGVDLVEQMIRVANGEELAIRQKDVKLNGWAVESRLYAEDPYRNFLPSIGRLSRYRPPEEVADATHVVRNDTGVYEGGEISMYYDPMIAKLCTWAPDRDAAIEEMRVALDTFEVEGIGHNLPFLSAVMDHEKFTSGNMTTAFIEEEFPDGFDGVELPDDMLRRVAASAAAMYRVAEIRRTRVSGRMDNHERKVGSDWVVSLQGQEFPVVIDADPMGATVTFKDGKSHRVSSDWVPGQSLAKLDVDGTLVVIKVGKIPGGFRMRLRGADMK
ncbi:MAG: acetyl-CoA carboxylase biotin carboxylase subunit, partial [Geopsychrobacter sp.]|nr:acetyl-CoA carboxylase biotin carboxylase subunit [Geopsychrobacter sp.]